MKKQMRRVMAIILTIALTMAFMPYIVTTNAAATPAVSFVKVNGKKVTFPDGQPIIQNGSTLVPIRFISEALGYTVLWDNLTKTADINNRRILITIGSSTAIANGEVVNVNVPAQLIKSGAEWRTYVPLRFISENLGCTVDWFNDNRSIIINALLENGKEVSLYDRCKQSDLFYEENPVNEKADPNWESHLYLKSSLSALTDEACYEGNWFIARFYSKYPNSYQREDGANMIIELKTPKLESRREIKSLLMTLYPTGYTQVYDLMMQTIREELFENHGTVFSTISGTYGTRYFDNREVSVFRLMSSEKTILHIKDFGYINPLKPILPTTEQHEWAIKNGLVGSGNFPTIVAEYHLDTW